MRHICHTIAVSSDEENKDESFGTYLIIVCMCVYNMISYSKFNSCMLLFCHQEGLALQRLPEASDM